MNNLSIGKGLGSLSVALYILGFMYLIYVLLRGIVLTDINYKYEKSYRNEAEARCASLEGYYSSNKCYIKGDEI